MNNQDAKMRGQIGIACNFITAPEPIFEDAKIRESEPISVAAEVELPPLDVVPQDLVDGYRSFDENRNDRVGAIGQIVGFGHLIGCRERQLKAALAELSRLSSVPKGDFEEWWAAYLSGRSIDPFPEKAALWNAKQAAWSAWHASVPKDGGWIEIKEGCVMPAGEVWLCDVGHAWKGNVWDEDRWVHVQTGDPLRRSCKPTHYAYIVAPPLRSL